MKYILIMWVSFYNSPNVNYENTVSFQEFDSKETCFFALKAVRQNANTKGGICVPK